MTAANDIFDLADSLGFKDLGRCGPQGVRPGVSADSEGRTEGARNAPGAVSKPSLPPQPDPPRFPPPHPAPPPRRS